MSLVADKSMQLFSDSEMFARKPVTQEEFEVNFRPYAPIIVNLIEKDWDMCKKCLSEIKSNYQNRNFKANILNSFIQGYISECTDFLAEISNGRFCFYLNGNKFFCKKVGKRLKPSNIPTKSVILYNNQQSINPSDIAPITYIGYQVHPSWSDLTGIFAIHMVENEIAWVSDLSSLAYEAICLKQDSAEDEVLVEIKANVKRKLM